MTIELCNWSKIVIASLPGDSSLLELTLNSVGSESGFVWKFRPLRVALLRLVWRTSVMSSFSLMHRESESAGPLWKQQRHLIDAIVVNNYYYRLH